MANFLPFKESYSGDVKYPSYNRAKGKGTKGIVNGFLARPGFSVNKLTKATISKSSVPFLRLNSFGCEDMEESSPCTSKFVASKTASTPNLNCVEPKSDNSTFSYLFGGLKGCRSSILNCEWTKHNSACGFNFSSSDSINRFKSVNKEKDRNNCDIFKCDINSSSPMNDMEVNALLIYDLVGDVSDSLERNNMIIHGDMNSFFGQSFQDNFVSQCKLDSLQNVNCVLNNAKELRPAVNENNIFPSKNCNNEVSHCKTNVISSASNCTSTVPSNLKSEFLVQTVQQRKNKEMKKMARKRKRNRQAKSLTSCNKNISKSSKSAHSLCNVEFTLCNSFENTNLEQNELSDSEFESLSDDENYCHVFCSDLISPLYLNSKPVKCQSINLSLDKEDSWDFNVASDSCISTDVTDELTVDEEIQQANEKWLEAYGNVCGCSNERCVLCDKEEVDESTQVQFLKLLFTCILLNKGCS